jgi:hypothetical protein
MVDGERLTREPKDLRRERQRAGQERSEEKGREGGSLVCSGKSCPQTVTSHGHSGSLYQISTITAERQRGERGQGQEKERRKGQGRSGSTTKMSTEETAERFSLWLLAQSYH